jgi:tRNA threonylcarbamoyladenosine biosynthesis protein TsaB
MKLLAVDTALGACSAALFDGEAILAHRLIVMERGHAEALAPMVQAIMREANVKFAGLDRLAVTTGPGTFTGQRVGLAFMRGLRVALKRALIGITTLEAMAAAAMKEGNTPSAAVLHRAKRGEVYVGLYGRDEIRLPPTLLSVAEAIAAIAECLGGAVVFAGTAAAEAANQYVRLGGEAVVSNILYPDALWVARLAMKAAETSDPPRPLYLRPPDARLPQRPV